MSLYVHLCVHKDHYIVKMGTQCSLSNLKRDRNEQSALNQNKMLYVQAMYTEDFFYICRNIFYTCFPPTPHILNT